MGRVAHNFFARETVENVATPGAKASGIITRLGHDTGVLRWHGGVSHRARPACRGTRRNISIAIDLHYRKQKWRKLSQPNQEQQLDSGLGGSRPPSNCEMKRKWIHPGNGRHYQVDLYMDLLGDWVLIRAWCGIKHRGNEKMSVVMSYQDGLSQIQRIERLRTRRGYQPVDLNGN